MYLRWKIHERTTDFTWLFKHTDLSKMTPRFLISLLSDDDRPPTTCLILVVMLSGAIIITSVLSLFSCRKLSDIHLLMDAKQFCRRDSFSSLSGLQSIYNWMSSASRYFKTTNNLAKRQHIQTKQQRAKHRTVWHTTSQRSRVWHVSYGQRKTPIRKIGG